MKRRIESVESPPVAGGGLLHPVPLAGVCLLLLNDHYLKRAAPGWATGKLSDVAGMLFFPLFLQALIEMGQVASRRSWKPSMRVLVGCTVATAVVFALTKCWAPATLLYEYVVAWLQFPFRWAFRGIEHTGRVHLVRDPSDLVALPFALVPLMIARREGPLVSRARTTPRAG